MSYENFRLAVYFTVNDVINLARSADIDKEWSLLERHFKTGKAYLETYRGGISADVSDIKKLKNYFINRGIAVSGGITTSMKPGKKRWSLMCYTSKEDLSVLENAVRLTAGNFDEVIFDDFYFTDCRCSSCSKAKGDLSWDEFRTKLLADVSRNIVMKTAREVNPNASMVIKFPNWYEHYQFTGYNLKDEPGIFDAVYTGTETREHALTQQNLPRYLSYFIYRYIEHAGKGRNRGAWFDNFDCYNPLDFSAQGLYSLLAKSGEITIFCYHLIKDTVYAPVIGYLFDKIDPLLGKLGTPMGIACYKPFHSRGEDYLHNYLGMCSIPLEPYCEYPSFSKDILLTESAVYDPDIAGKILTSLYNSGRVIITSGFWKALDPSKQKQLSTIRMSDRKISAERYSAYPKNCSYKDYYTNKSPVTFPLVEWPTNDIWAFMAGENGKSGSAILLKQQYGDGELVFLNIPDNISDLYRIPADAWNVIRKELCFQYAWVDCDPGVSLFLYDNKKAAVHSELDHPSEMRIFLPGSAGEIESLRDGRKISGTENEGVFCYKLYLNPGEWEMVSW